MDSNQIHPKIKDVLAKNSNVGVVVTKNPSVDHMAAGLSLFLSLRQMGKTSVIASPTAPTVEVASLVGIDKVKNDLGGDGGDLTVAFPYREGEIEKVSYTLENGYLNIVVKSGDKGLNFQEKDIKFKRSGKAPQVLFFVGVPRLSDLGNLFNPEALKDTTIINIDNKPDNQGFGDIVVVSPKSSSVSEQIAHFLLSVDGHDMDVDIAQNLLSGIAHATNDFQDPRTSPIAFEMAGVLMQKGAVRKSQRQTQQEDQQRRDHATSFMPQQQPQPRPRNPFQQFQQPQRPQQPFGQPHQAPVQPQSQNMQQPQPQQNMPQNNQQPTQNQNSNPQRQTPPDWLTPKVYKGSTVL